MSFFDNLGQKLNDVGQTTIKKTKDLADTAKMNLEISEEERKISNAHEQIGKWYAAKYRMQADPEIQNWMDAILHQKQKSKHVAITSVRSKVRPLARSVERVLQQMRSSARIVDRRLYRNSQLRT